MLATVPGGPKTSYVKCLGLKGLVSSVLVSEYEGRFSEPKMPCSRDTVNPPAAITTTMTNGIHSRLRTPKIANPRFRRLFRDPPRARGAGEGWGAGRKKGGRRPDRWLTSRRSATAPSDRASATSRTSFSTTAPDLPPVSRAGDMLAARTVNYASAATPLPTVHRMGWASQANPAAVTSNVRRLGDRDQILTSKPCRWPPHRLFPNAIWGTGHLRPDSTGTTRDETTWEFTNAVSRKVVQCRLGYPNGATACIPRWWPTSAAA